MRLTFLKKRKVSKRKFARGFPNISTVFSENFLIYSSLFFVDYSVDFLYIGNNIRVFGISF